MPLFTDDMDERSIPGAGNFKYKTERIDNLGSSSYALVTISIDISKSTFHFASVLLEMVKNIIMACKQNSLSETILVRLVVFNHELNEIHGFKLLDDINPDDYEPFVPKGFTALKDALYSSVGASEDFSEYLIKQEYREVVSVCYTVTDGWDNVSTMTEESIKGKIEKANANETVSSLTTILIGLCNPTDTETVNNLKKLKEDAGLSDFVNFGNATPDKLAQIGNMVSQHISSTSQSLKNKTSVKPSLRV
jgi:hypothetical protein